MQTKISKTLEGILARTAFDTAKQGRTDWLKDRLALSLLEEEGSLARRLLAARLEAWELYQIRLRIGSEIEKPDPAAPQRPDEFYKAFAGELHRRFAGTATISTAHALLSIVSDPRTHTARILEMYRITVAEIGNGMERIDEGEEPAALQIRMIDLPDDKPAHGDRMLDKFGTDLTRQAREGKIDPVIGRDREIERVIEILSRRKKNNPILIGEAGVGKSAIVEGLALRMAAGKVPYTIAGKTLYALDVASLVAGTKFRGEFEERMQQLLEELHRSKDTILFIDEIHTIVGAGSTQGSLDTANILKPALARGELQTIGATTLDEYRQNIERDTALERRFQKVVVEPTSPEQTLCILRNIAPRYERHHKVRYRDDALEACVALADRYITDRYFPDKAIDILDEAGARAHLLCAQEPEDLRQMEAELASVQLERKRAAGQSVYDKAASARLRELALRTRLGESRAAWHRELERNPADIHADQIAQVITAMTGIPIERISDDERNRLRGLHDYLSSRVIGQEEAVRKISCSIRRSRAGLADGNRPIGVFLFVGPTGVGKTLLAKELSKWLFDEHRGLIRIDMSEYGEKHNVSRLIGSPPGYVGYGEGGQLTEAVRRQPYAVILFDEIEKAHPEVFNTLLQLFDEGQLTDGSGRRVDFRNTIVIMTSNVGSRTAVQRTQQVGYTTRSKSTAEQTAPVEEYRKALEETFAPEFLNRINDIVIFRSLSIEHVERIIDLELSSLLRRTRRLGYRIEITDAARHRLAELGYESRYGARALRRTLLDRVEEPLSDLIIDGALREGNTIRIVTSGNSVALKVA